MQVFKIFMLAFFRIVLIGGFGRNRDKFPHRHPQPIRKLQFGGYVKDFVDVFRNTHLVPLPFLLSISIHFRDQ